MSERCRYRKADKDLPYPRVLWDADCGYQYALMQGYNPDWNSNDHNKILLPEGICSKCGKKIEGIL